MISRSQRARRLSLFSHLLWLFIAVTVWSGRQFWEWKRGLSFSLIVYAKGFLLLWLAALIYGEACRRRPGYLFLGFFPLLWLSISRLQWDICSQSDPRYWIWLAVFLLLEFFLLALRDGRQLLGLSAFLMSVLSFLFPFSLPCFLSFGWAGNGRHLKNANWVRCGLPSAGLILYFAMNAPNCTHLFFYDLFQVLLNDHFIGFFLLGWLGALALATRRSRWTPAFGPVFLLCVGFLFLSGPDYFSPLKQDLLKWVLIFFAGFGWESFRRDIIDHTWHGRLLWFALGICFFGGVL